MIRAGLGLGLATATLAVASPAYAEAWEFVLINLSGKTIRTVELAPAGTQAWQPNQVDPDVAKPDATVRPGARMTVHLDRGPGCGYDIRIGLTDGSSSVWPQIDICDNSYVTVKYSAAGAPLFTGN